VIRSNHILFQVLDSSGFNVSQPAFQRSVDFRFSTLKGARRVWTIPSIHGEAERLRGLHDQLLRQIKPGDRIVYLGNYIGRGADSAGVVEEILAFRRMVLAVAGFQPGDIVYLRGQQEELLQRVFQLQFASSPWVVYEWMLEQGLGATLGSYGIDMREGLNAAAADTGRLARWTGFVRHMIYRHEAHDVFFGALKRAAYTATEGKPMLFVNAGVKTDLRLEDQGDRFWWGGDDFQTITDAYDPYARVVRGYDPQRRGLYINCVTATMDNGCGFGGSLACASWLGDASIGQIFEA
jgi:serine/threonine protein phosphatase 1